MRALAAAASLLWAGALFGQPLEYHFRPTPESQLALIVEKTGLWRGRKHVFEFQKYTARAMVNPTAPADSSVEVSVDAGSATCRDDWVSEPDRAKVLAFMRRDMLDVEHYPVLTFRSERIVAAGKDTYEILGRLAIRGIEKPAAVTAHLENRNGSLVVNGEAMVKLSDYGLKPPKAALGTIGTKNEMTVRFRLVSVPKSN